MEISGETPKPKIPAKTRGDFVFDQSAHFLTLDAKPIKRVDCTTSGLDMLHKYVINSILGWPDF